MRDRFAGWTEGFQSSVVCNILKLTQGKEMISFAGGLPAEELFPVEAVREAASRVLTAGKSALQYTEGYLPLREQLCGRMAGKGMTAAPDEMILTTGSRQAIDLIVRVLTEPGDAVLVENPTHPAPLQAFSFSGLRVIPVESDKDGMIIPDAERLIREHRPRLVYAVPTFGNPTGRAWSMERRKGLLELSVRYGMPIVEDDPYGEIKFDENADFPTLFFLAEQMNIGSVLYTSTFSRTVASELRTGWAMGDRSVIAMMIKAKQAVDLHSNSLDQQVLDQLLRHFPLDAHIRKIAGEYGSRMRHMQKLLRGSLRGVRWAEPQGGLFLWMQLPEGLDAEALLRCAAAKGVVFVPGAPFYVKEPQRNTVRLSFTSAQGEDMELGIERFAEAVNEFVARC